MKILITTGIYPPDIGGPATYSKLLFDELSKKGIEAKVLSFGSVRHLPKIIRHIVYFLKILKQAKNVDIVYAQDPVSVGLPTALASKILRKKFLLKIVGDYAWEQGRQRFGVKDTLDVFINKKYNFFVTVFKKIETFTANSADKIITPSNYLKGIISNWGVDSNKIKVVYNSFDAPEIKEGKEEIRKKFNFSGFILISVGRLVPWKGFGTMIEVMPDILKVIPDAKLIIVGSGPEKQNLESKIIENNLQENVLMTGQTTHNEVLAYLKAGDLFVLNTSYEGLSHQLLEAMVVGIPIVTTRVGGNPETIDSSIGLAQEGVLVAYNDKEAIQQSIINLYEDKDLREKIIKNAKIKVQGFNKEKMINGVIEVLNLL